MHPPQRLRRQPIAALGFDADSEQSGRTVRGVERQGGIAVIAAVAIPAAANVERHPEYIDARPDGGRPALEAAAVRIRAHDIAGIIDRDRQRVSRTEVSRVVSREVRDARHSPRGLIVRNSDPQFRGPCRQPGRANTEECRNPGCNIEHPEGVCIFSAQAGEASVTSRVGNRHAHRPCQRSECRAAGTGSRWRRSSDRRP